MSRVRPTHATDSSEASTVRKVLLDGLVFPESRRWFGDTLWFADMFGKRVMTVQMDGTAKVIAEFDDWTSGIGFLPDGSPIVVLMKSRKIVRLSTDGSPSLHADLTSLPADLLNDMVVDSTGRAYVDCLRRPVADSLNSARGDSIALVEPNGQSRILETGELIGPNGLAI